MNGISKTICSADEWFYVHGQYTWNKGGLDKAHQYSKGQFALAMLERHQVIVIDNTNMKSEHFMRYVDYAMDYHYKAVIVEWKRGDEGEVARMTRRSPHVPNDYPAWSKYFKDWDRSEEFIHQDTDVVKLDVVFAHQTQDTRAHQTQENVSRGYYSNPVHEVGSAVTQVNYRARGFDRDIVFRSRGTKREFAD